MSKAGRLNIIEDELNVMLNVIDRKFRMKPIELNEEDVNYLERNAVWTLDFVGGLDIENSEDDEPYIYNTIEDGLERIVKMLYGNDYMDKEEMMELKDEIMELNYFVKEMF